MYAVAPSFAFPRRHASEIPRDLLQIVGEQTFGDPPLIARAQHRRRMNGREHHLCPRRLDGNAALFHHAERWAEEGFGSRCSEAQNDVGLHDGDLVLEPGETRANLAGVRRLVQPSLAACVARPLEMLDRVGEVDVFPVDARGLERAIEEFPRRSDERTSGDIFDVAGCFADDHESRAARTLAKHGLGGVLVEVASATPIGRGAKLRERRPRGDEISGGAGWLHCSSRPRRAADDLRAAGDSR
jgi:hypothetical protein